MTFQRALTLLLAAGIFFCACKKPSLDDTSLIPDDNLGILTDTLSLEVTSVREDSIDVSAATLGLFGSMNDPLIGATTNASFYVPFKLPSNNLTLDDTTVTLDSVVLMLWCFDAYGDWRISQSAEVYEMTEDLIDSVQYSSDKIFTVNPNPVGTKSFRANTTDTLEVNGIKYPPSVRIRLDNSFGQKFIDAQGTTDFADNTNFRRFFKGLYVTTSRAGGGKGIVAIDPYTNGVHIALYYHDVFDSAGSKIFAADAALIVNHVTHDYRNSSVTTAGDSIFFLQGMAGYNALVKAPTLRNLGDILINKAELVVTVLPESLDNDTFFSPPPKLTLLVSDSAGNFNGTTSDQAFPSSIFGGTLEQETDSATNQKLIKYKFSLSRYYQEVISREREDFGIFILPDKRYQTPNRLVAGGSNHSRYALKLNLVYELID